MAGYVNSSAPISDRALQIARDSIPQGYLGEYLFYRLSVPETDQTESYCIVLCDRLVAAETGYDCYATGDNRVAFIEFGFLEIPANSSATEGVCVYNYRDSSSFIRWPVVSQYGTLVYGSDLGLPHLVELGGDPYAFSLVVLAIIVCIYLLFYNIWHHWIME